MALLEDFDKRGAGIVRSLPDGVRPLMEAFTFLGEPVVVGATATAGFISAVVREQAAIQKAFILGAVAFSVNTLLKLVLRRRRPYGRIVMTLGVNSYSFPSGHAFGSVIFYGLLAILDARYLARPWNILTAFFIWLLVGLIGLSRIYLRYHYPSDVLAGWALGGLSLLAVYLLAF